MRTLTSALVVLFTAATALGNTYTVTNTSDSGAGSLRQAILDANANPGADTITFAVAGAGCDGSGVCTILPQSALPLITDAVTIDGYTQAGAAANTNASGAINAALKIVVSGVNDPNHMNDAGLDFESGSEGSTIKGLVVNGFDSGISISVSNGTVRGCFIGTDASGMTAVGDNRNGFSGSGSATGITVGGPLAADRNLIAGNWGQDVGLGGVGATVEGNLIGTDATGAATLPVANPARQGTYTPIEVSSVGGTTYIRGNVVGASIGAAILVGLGSPSSFDTILQGNFVGTDATGTVDLGNSTVAGIELDTTDVTVGGTGAGEGNVIAFNGRGVYLDPDALRCTIRGNSIHSNGRRVPYSPQGIQFFNPNMPIDYFTPFPNDPEDADTGPNAGQNFPIITSAVSSGPNTTTITGVLNSAPNTLFTLDFYSNPSCVTFPRSYYEGRTYLGSDQVTTDGNGNAPISSVLPVAMDPGSRVTATATDPDGNTSEFSQRMVIHTTPGGGNPAGFEGAKLIGFNFLPGATVTVGGVAAPSVSVDDYNDITFTTPSLPPGTVNDITVTNTDGSAGTIPNGWIADFVDVPLYGNGFWQWVTTLVRNQITAGIGNALYGVDDPAKRKQMAVFLLKSKYGVCYTPPPCVTEAFADVPCSSGFAPWINELVAEGITGGCGGGNYCPDSPVNRQQMAVFLLKTHDGGSYVPPDCTSQNFADVPCSSPFAPWIYELVRRGITAGCGGGNYCPLNPNTRGQMAVFLTNTFNLY